MKHTFRPNQLLIITGRLVRKGDFVTYVRPSIHKKVWVKDRYNKEIVLRVGDLTPIEPNHQEVNYTPPAEAQP